MILLLSSWRVAESMMLNLHCIIVCLDDHNQPVSSQEEYFRLTRDQITELVAGYQGLVEIWIDIPSVLTPEQRTELYSIVKTHQPECLVTCNNGFSDGTTLDNFPADITNGERTLPPVTGHNPKRQINGRDVLYPDGGLPDNKSKLVLDARGCNQISKDALLLV